VAKLFTHVLTLLPLEEGFHLVRPSFCIAFFLLIRNGFLLLITSALSPSFYGFLSLDSFLFFRRDKRFSFRYFLPGQDLKKKECSMVAAFFFSDFKLVCHHKGLFESSYDFRRRGSPPSSLSIFPLPVPPIASKAREFSSAATATPSFGVFLDRCGMRAFPVFTQTTRSGR